MTSATTHAPHPWIWLFLNLPFGATYGFIAVTLGYVATQQGLDEEAVAGLVAACLLPHTWKFLWAPVADLTFTRKGWYLVSNVASCVTIASLGFIPLRENLDVVTGIILLNSVFISFLGMAVEGLMAHTIPPDQLGRSAGWFQAGNLGGSGIGGGLALLIAERSSPEVAAVFTAGLLGACTLGLLGVRTPYEPRESQALERVKAVGRDVWQMLASRRGIVALALCLVPMCAGAAVGLFAAIGHNWGASSDLIALMQGVLGGLVSAVGCLLGGMLSDRMSRRNAYVLSGVILAAVAAAMAAFPKVPVTFAVFVLAYNLTTGICYGCFTGFVLEVIGKGAAATKYNALASLSNIPILYMTLLLGYISASEGATTMLIYEAVLGLLGAGVIMGLAYLLKVGGRHEAPRVSPTP